MAKRANIVTFDDAKSASQRRRAREGYNSRSRSESRYAPFNTPRNSDFVKPKHLQTSSRYGNDYDELYWDEPDSSFYWDEMNSFEEPSARRRSRSSARRASGEFEEMWDESPARRRSEAGRSRGKRENKKRERTKSRAEKMFARQYEAEGPSSAQPEGAPRAALYEGKMGSSHRRSARMQRASTAVPQSAKLNPAGWFANITVSARTLKVCTAMLCLVLVGVFLYVPAQQYYQSIREHDRLAAEYAYIEQRNQALDSQNTALASNAGMEDAVRQKYGYVVSGDEAAIVTGLSDHATDTSRDSDGIEANVLASSVKAPEEWYTPYLDALFGVS